MLNMVEVMSINIIIRWSHIKLSCKFRNIINLGRDILINYEIQTLLGIRKRWHPCRFEYPTEPRTWFCSLKVQHTIGTFLFCLNQQNAQKEIPPCFSTNWVPHWEKSAPLTAVNLTKFNLIRRLIRPFLISALVSLSHAVVFPNQRKIWSARNKACADGHTMRNRAAK